MNTDLAAVVTLVQAEAIPCTHIACIPSFDVPVSLVAGSALVDLPADPDCVCQQSQRMLLWPLCNAAMQPSAHACVTHEYGLVLAYAKQRMRRGHTVCVVYTVVTTLQLSML